MPDGILIPPGQCAGHSLRLAVIVAIVGVGARIVTFVPLWAPVPAMVMGQVAALAFPATLEILSADVIRRDPVRAFIRRPRPVAVVPPIVSSLRIPVALDPEIVWARLGRHAVDARRRRFTNTDSK